MNATRSAGSPAPPEHFAFGVRMTVEGAATAHSSHSVSANSVPPYDSQTQHYLHIQVTLREGQGLNPSPEYAWKGSIITDVFSKTEDLTKAVVLELGQDVLFFCRLSRGEGISYE